MVQIRHSQTLIEANLTSIRQAPWGGSTSCPSQ